MANNIPRIPVTLGFSADEHEALRLMEKTFAKLQSKMDGETITYTVKADESQLRNTLKELQKLGIKDLQISVDDKEIKGVQSILENLIKEANSNGINIKINGLDKIDGALSGVQGSLKDINEQIDNLGSSGSGITKVEQQFENIGEQAKETAKEVEQAAKRMDKALSGSTTTPKESGISSASKSQETPVLSENTPTQIKQNEELAESIYEVYRAYNKMSGINGEKGISWFSSDFDTMMTYLKEHPDRELIKGKLDFSKLLNIDAQGALHNAITYLGDGSDEASRQITDLYNRIQTLKASFEETPSDKLQQEIHELELEYDKLSEDTSNLYGTHTTNWFAIQAQEAGYLGVAIRNVIDDYNGLIDKPSTTIALFDLDQLREQQRITEEVLGTVDQLQQVSFDTKKAIGEDVVKFVDSKDVSDLQDELREVQEFNSLMKLTEMTAEELGRELREVFSYAHENPDVLNNLFDYDSRLVDVFDKDTNIGKYFESMISSTNFGVNESQLDSIYIDIAKKLQEYESEYIKQVISKLQSALSPTNAQEEIVPLPDTSSIDKVKDSLEEVENQARETAQVIQEVANTENDERTLLSESDVSQVDKTTEALKEQKQATESATNALVEMHKAENQSTAYDTSGLERVEGEIVDVVEVNERLEDSAKASAQWVEQEGNSASASAKDMTELYKAKAKAVEANLKLRKSAQDSVKALTDEGNAAEKAGKKVSGVSDADKYQREASNMLHSFNKKYSSYREYDDHLGDIDGIRKQISSITNEDDLLKVKNQIDALGESLRKVQIPKDLAKEKWGNKFYSWANKNTKAVKHFRAEFEALEIQYKNISNIGELEEFGVNLTAFMRKAEQAGMTGLTFFDQVKNRMSSIFQSAISMVGIYDIIAGLKNVANKVIDIDTAMTELKKVSSATLNEINNSFDDMADSAKDYGSTVTDMINATADWSKNGYGLEDSKALAEISVLYKNVGDDIDIDTANESLISTMQGFQLEAEDAMSVIDKFNAVANTESISSAGIGEALQRSAASFNAANTDLSKSIALITATNEVIQDPTSVGTLWKTLSARIRGKICAHYTVMYRPLYEDKIKVA